MGERGKRNLDSRKIPKKRGGPRKNKKKAKKEKTENPG